MFKRAAIRPFSTLKPRQFRFPSRSSKLPDSESLKVYRVKFKKPPLPGRIVNGLIFYGIPFLLLWYYVVPVTLEMPLADEDEKMKPDGSVEVDDEEELEDGYFIPFGWPKKEPKKYYKGSDPEWKEYIKLSRDPKRKLDIQLLLAKGIRSEIARIPSFKRSKVDINKGRYWLWIKFPEGPPQDYQVSGLEIGEDFIAWSTKIVPQREYQSLARIMFPTAAMKATWTVIRYHWETQANKVRGYLGFKQHIDPETAMLKGLLTAHITAKQREEQKLVPPLIPSKEKTSTPTTNSKVDTSTSESDAEKPPPLLSGLRPQANKMPISTIIFMHTMGRAREKKKSEPPRGSIEVKGMVEVVSRTGLYILDVEANYDLTTDKFLEWSFKARESIRRSGILPKGGK